VAIEKYRENVREIKKDATKAENAMRAVLGDTKNKGGHDSDLNSDSSDGEEYESDSSGGEFEKESESSESSIEIKKPKKSKK
jgi:hypothetical protein